MEDIDELELRQHDRLSAMAQRGQQILASKQAQESLGPLASGALLGVLQSFINLRESFESLDADAHRLAQQGRPALLERLNLLRVVHDDMIKLHQSMHQKRVEAEADDRRKLEECEQVMAGLRAIFDQARRERAQVAAAANAQVVTAAYGRLKQLEARYQGEIGACSDAVWGKGPRQPTQTIIDRLERDRSAFVNATADAEIVDRNGDPAWLTWLRKQISDYGRMIAMVTETQQENAKRAAANAERERKHKEELDRMVREAEANRNAVIERGIELNRLRIEGRCIHCKAMIDRDIPHICGQQVVVVKHAY